MVYIEQIADATDEERDAVRETVERRTVLKRAAAGVGALPLGAGRTVGIRRKGDALAPGEADESDEDDAPEYALDEISRRKYGYEFDELSAETSGQVEELFNRQPYDDELELGDLRTREEIAAERYGRRPEELSRESRFEVEDDYRVQFKCPKSGFGYGLRDIARAKYDRKFEELSDETAAAVYEIRHRQPFHGDAEPEDILTRDEISQERHGRDFDELSRETTVEVQHALDWQFACTPIGNENEE